MRELANDIVDVLAPVIGKGLAISAVNMQCNKMGILPENLSEDNIEIFSDHFKKVMLIFAGEQIADDIVMQIKKINK